MSIDIAKMINVYSDYRDQNGDIHEITDDFVFFLQKQMPDLNEAQIRANVILKELFSTARKMHIFKEFNKKNGGHYRYLFNYSEDDIIGMYLLENNMVIDVIDETLNTNFDVLKLRKEYDVIRDTFKSYPIRRK